MKDTEDNVMLAYPVFVAKLFKPMDREIDMILHAAVGLSGEAGEVIDCVKKTWAYNKTLDKANLKEEAGDILFYLTALCNLMGWSISEIASENMAKLSKRYGSGTYSDAQAQARADKQEA